MQVELGGRCTNIHEFQEGARVIVKDAKGFVDRVFTVQEILHEGTNKKEVLFVDGEFRRQRNIYFIWSMYIDGSSWVKAAWIINE
jgi:hypothetical protein